MNGPRAEVLGVSLTCSQNDNLNLMEFVSDEIFMA